MQNEAKDGKRICPDCNGSGQIEDMIYEGDTPINNWGTNADYSGMPCGSTYAPCSRCHGTGKVTSDVTDKDASS